MVGQFSWGILTFWFISWVLAPVVVVGPLVVEVVKHRVVDIEVEPVGMVAMVEARIMGQRSSVVAIELELWQVIVAVVGNRLGLEVAVGKLELVVVYIVGLAMERLFELVVAVVPDYISFETRFFLE